MPNQIVILCIDDNSTALRIRQAMLESRGFVVRTATDGLSGLEIASQEPIQAVILDYKMAEMDGEEVAKRLRAQQPHLPILLLSGFHGLIPESLLALVDGFFQKGSPASLFLEEVERLTGADADPRAQERRRA